MWHTFHFEIGTPTLTLLQDIARFLAEPANANEVRTRRAVMRLQLRHALGVTRAPLPTPCRWCWLR